jgi:hypothetical protein
MIHDAPKAKHVWMVGLMIRECDAAYDSALCQSHLNKCPLFVQAKSINHGSFVYCNKAMRVGDRLSWEEVLLIETNQSANPKESQNPPKYRVEGDL